VYKRIPDIGLGEGPLRVACVSTSASDSHGPWVFVYPTHSLASVHADFGSYIGV
jgi:hypothetical protein